MRRRHREQRLADVLDLVMGSYGWEGGAPVLSDGMSDSDFGLCADCMHARLNHTRRGTTYLRCTRAAWDDRLVRYPHLPVRRCPGFTPRSSVPAAPGSSAP